MPPELRLQTTTTKERGKIGLALLSTPKQVQADVTNRAFTASKPIQRHKLIEDIYKPRQTKITKQLPPIDLNVQPHFKDFVDLGFTARERNDRS